MQDILLFIGLEAVVSAVFAAGYWFGRKAAKPRKVGRLRVNHSDPDGPYLFLELDRDCGDFAGADYIVLEVAHEDFT